MKSVETSVKIGYAFSPAYMKKGSGQMNSVVGGTRDQCVINIYISSLLLNITVATSHLLRRVNKTQKFLTLATRNGATVWACRIQRIGLRESGF